MIQINNLNLKKWKEYQKDITTDSLWIGNKKEKDGKFIIPKRDFLPKNSKTFHGIFIPEIPYQFISRFTKEGELVWDCFAGSGTTHKVAKLLNRKCILTDINPVESFIKYGDARTFKLKEKCQLIIMHPPYMDIVKYSNKIDDLSHWQDIDNFLLEFEECVKNVIKQLDKNRFLILVCGNIYKNSEELTLGVWCKDIICRYGFKLKSHIIKDYGETKGGNKNYNLNYYRQLRGNYNNFYGDNIFVMQKQKKSK